MKKRKQDTLKTPPSMHNTHLLTVIARDNKKLKRTIQALCVGFSGIVLIMVGVLVVISTKSAESATIPGTCLPESKGGTNCDPVVIKNMYESNTNTNSFSDSEKAQVSTLSITNEDIVVSMKDPNGTVVGDLYFRFSRYGNVVSTYATNVPAGTNWTCQAGQTLRSDNAVVPVQFRPQINRGAVFQAFAPNDLLIFIASYGQISMKSQTSQSLTIGQYVNASASWIAP